MRKFLTITAAAPLALLAACGDSEPDEDMAIDADQESVMTEDADMAMSEDGPATRLEDAGDFSGTYTAQGSDGTSRSLTLDSSDDSYEYTASDGTTRTGNFTRLDDGYRLQIEDYDGSPGYFTFSNGELVQLENDTEMTADSMASGERYSNDDAVFSRDPELASPVAPDV